jgi:raffinose/stachyose/melibiose transport system permease protein
MTPFSYTRRTFLREVILILAAAVFCIPLYIVLVMSLKTNQQITTTPLSLPLHPQFSNYREAWNGTADLTIYRALINTAIITVGSVVLLVICGSLCAYVLARRVSKLSTGLYLLFVTSIVLPVQLGVVPIYVEMRNTGLAGTYPGMILLYTGLFMPLSVFLYAGFMRTLPATYEEAAQIDGASLRRTFVRVVFPLLGPVTATVAVLAGVFIWNEFFMSLIFLSGTHKAMITVAIYGFVGEYASQWNYIMAAVVISIIPILAFYVFAQKQLVRGFTGGIRG